VTWYQPQPPVCRTCIDHHDPTGATPVVRGATAKCCHCGRMTTLRWDLERREPIPTADPVPS
jgi:hypothetical protein